MLIHEVTPVFASTPESYDTTLASGTVTQTWGPSGVEVGTTVLLAIDGADESLAQPGATTCPFGPSLRVPVAEGRRVWLAVGAESTKMVQGKSALDTTYSPALYEPDDTGAVRFRAPFSSLDYLVVAAKERDLFDMWIAELGAPWPTQVCPLLGWSHPKSQCARDQHCDYVLGAAPENECLKNTCYWDTSNEWEWDWSSAKVCKVLPDPAKQGAPCHTDDPCVSEPVCLPSGICGAAVEDPCDDGDPCTTDMCLPTVGCEHEPIPDGGACGAFTHACYGPTCSSGICIEGPQCFCEADIDCPVHEAPDSIYICSDAGVCMSALLP